jgi:hypothetical protein
MKFFTRWLFQINIFFLFVWSELTCLISGNRVFSIDFVLTSCSKWFLLLLSMINYTLHTLFLTTQCTFTMIFFFFAIEFPIGNFPPQKYKWKFFISDFSQRDRTRNTSTLTKKCIQFWKSTSECGDAAKHFHTTCLKIFIKKQEFYSLIFSLYLMLCNYIIIFNSWLSLNHHSLLVIFLKRTSFLLHQTVFKLLTVVSNFNVF